jgi:hypothetical protein
MMPRVDDTMMSGTVAGEAEGSGWHVEVKDDQRKLGRWTEYMIGPNC